MSLVGSLEDLGLGDILQIINLSGKSGVLEIRTDSGAGQILFDQGLLRGAFRKGGPTSLRELLAARNAVPEAELEAAWQDAHCRGGLLGEVLCDRGLLDTEALDRLRRENIETAVFEMFGWDSGEFSFEVRDLQGAGEELFMTPGVNPQFLALEGTRRVDEDAWGAEEDIVFDGEGEAAAESGGGTSSAVELVAEVVEVADSDLILLDAAEALPLEPEPPQAGGQVEPEPPRAAVQVQPETPVVKETPQVAAARVPPLIVVDTDLAVLEWLKDVLDDVFPRVHIFQRSDLGVHRIRQYLGRAEVPLVLLAADAPPDPVTGAKNASEMVQRLKRLAPRMPIWVMHSKGSAAPESPHRGPHADGKVEKPTPTHLADPRAEEVRRALGAALREALRNAGPAPAHGSNAPAGALARLKEAHSRISDPASRGDVLRQVLSFASQNLARVVLFMIREDEALGIAQVGLAKAGGPDEAGLRGVHLDAREPGWFRAVLESRTPYRGGPLDEGDQQLALMLGNDIPEEAWVAPIQSADRVVAILYGDNLPAGNSIGDTGALEVVVDSAGMALDRAFLETLAEG